MAWIRCCGGGTTNEVNTDLGSLALANPSNTALSDVNRTWTKNTYCKGLTDNNVYVFNNVTIVARAGNSVTINSSAAGYGFAYVLPNNVVPNKTVTVNFTKSANTALGVANYGSDGLYLNTTYLSPSTEAAGTYTKTFSLPNNAEYGVLVYIPYSANTDVSLTLNTMTIA